MKALRTWVAISVIGVCAAIAAATYAATPASSEVAWTQFRRGNDNNAVVSGPTAVRWHVVTGGGGPISASPTISGSLLFVGNNKGYLTAIDVPSGRVIWERHVMNPLMSAPILYGSNVIVGEGNEDSPPTGPLFVGSGHNAIVAFHQYDGSNAWATTLAGSAMPTGAIIGGLFVEHNGAGWITALDPETGAKKYAVDVHTVASMSAALPIGDSFATVGVQDNAALLVHAADGSIVWRTTFPGEASGLGDCPQVTDGNYIFCNYLMPGNSGDSYVPIGGLGRQHAYALDVKTGKKVWDIALESGTVPIRNEAAIPLISNGVLYFGSAIAPVMHAVDPKTGRVLWTRKVKAPVKGGVVAMDGAVYFGDLAGYLWALDARSGAVIGAKKMGSGFNVGSPVLYGRTLIQGSRVGTVYAVPIDDIRNARDA